MITKKDIENIIQNQGLVEDLFVVDIQVSGKNEISVLVDTPDGVNINDCTAISRLIENSLDREKEDFELKVSSPGLDQPLKVYPQYVKNIGREVAIIKTNGEKLKGKLIQVNQNSVIIESKEKVKVEGKKKKQTIIQKPEIKFEEIKSTKIVISFK